MPMPEEQHRKGDARPLQKAPYLKTFGFGFSGTGFLEGFLVLGGCEGYSLYNHICCSRLYPQTKFKL